MFLQNITINNYRSISKAQAQFEKGLNIVIGKNGAGKSNLLQYIYRNVSWRTINSLTKQYRVPSVEFEFTICYDDQEEQLNALTLYYKRERVVNNNELDSTQLIRISKKRNNLTVYEDRNYDISRAETLSRENKEILRTELNVLKNLKKTYITFNLPSELGWLEKSVKYEIDIEYNLEIDNFFPAFAILDNLQDTIEFNFITQITQPEEVSKIEDIDTEQVKKVFFQSFDNFKTKFSLDNSLAKYSPIEELRLNPNINCYYAENKILIENLIVEFRINDSWIPWSYLSDGTKRLFYLITECLSASDGILLIEEPELGIHPHQLFSLMQFIRDQAYHKQIIVSTHSPIVLDILSPNELSRITIAKLNPTGSQFIKLTNEQIETAQKYMELTGELSYYWLHSDLENE